MERASSKSSVRSTASVVCLCLPCLSVRHRLLVHIGQAHLQYYAEPSAEPLPATSTALQATILPLGPGMFTHNAAGVPIVVVCTKADLIDDTNDLVGAGSSGMGGMVKGKGDEWEERTDAIMQILRTVCLKCTCPDDCNCFIFIYLAHLQMVPAFSTRHLNRRHSMSCASTRYMPFSYPPLQLPKALLKARPHRRVTHFRSCISQTHSTVTVLWSRQAGTAGERLQCCVMGLTRKRGARRGSTISRPSLAPMEGLKLAHGNSMRRSCQTKARRHAFLSPDFPFCTLGLTQVAIADPAPVV